MNKLVSICALCIFILLIYGCDKVEDVPEIELEVVSRTYLSLPEPSDLAWSADGKNLWTVSDHTGMMYLISKDGKTLKEVDVEGNDLEGITVISENRLAVVFEKKRSVVIIDTNGIEIEKENLDFSDEYNLGLEGITYNPDTKHFFAVNEKDPMIIIELDRSLKVVDTVDIAVSDDLSAIFYEKTENVFWLLSHESKMIIKTSPRFEVLKKYLIDMQQPEGIAVDKANNLVYVVSDADNEFVIFKLN